MTSTAVPFAYATGSSAPTRTLCTAADLLRRFGMSGQAGADADQIRFAMRRVHAGCPLVVEGQPFEKLHLVSGGSFKCVQTDSEGYEQVLAFSMQGDFIGLDALGQGRHHSGAVALEEALVVALPVREILGLQRQLPALETLLLHAAGAEVLRLGDNQHLMAAPSSEVRVVRFLLQFARRQATLGHSGRRLRMCMTRRDIASYLGVAHETVSRVLTALDHEGYIRVSLRDIELIDFAALGELQRVTRGRQARERRSDIARQTAAVALRRAAQGASGLRA